MSNYSLARLPISIRIYRFAHATVGVGIIKQHAYALLYLLTIGAKPTIVDNLGYHNPCLSTLNFQH